MTVRLSYEDFEFIYYVMTFKSITSNDLKHKLDDIMKEIKGNVYNSTVIVEGQLHKEDKQ